MRLHSPVLVTTDLQRLRRFYVDTIGLQVTADFGGCVILDGSLSIWQPGPGHPVEALPGPDPTETTARSFELCFEADTVEEFQRVAQALAGSGQPLLHPVREEPWGQRTLRVFDPDGHLLEWGESIPCFVRRLYQANRSAETTARITGVPLQQVERLLERG